MTGNFSIYRFSSNYIASFVIWKVFLTPFSVFLLNRRALALRFPIVNGLTS